MVDERQQFFLKALRPIGFIKQHILFIFQLEHIGYLWLFGFIEIKFMNYFIGKVARTKDFKPKNLHFY